MRPGRPPPCGGFPRGDGRLAGAGRAARRDAGERLMAAARPRAPLGDDAPHVLVVDDDRRLRDLLARFLGDNGYRVTAAADAAEASSRLAQIQFDVMVLDVMMPGENGFDFAARLRRTLNTPILMLTARGDPQDR